MILRWREVMVSVWYMCLLAGALSNDAEFPSSVASGYKGRMLSSGANSKLPRVSPRTKYLRDGLSARSNAVPAARRDAYEYFEEIRFFYEQRQRLSAQLRKVEAELESYGFAFGAQIDDKDGALLKDKPLEVALSTEEHPMSCRILIEAAPGAKVIAPCNCHGTLKWIQFSEFNQLRRQEPDKCGLTSTALAAILDNPKLLRSVVLITVIATVVAFRHLLLAAIIWFLNSKYLWTLRPLWAFVVYGGYVMQMMTARVAAEALWEGYKRLERKVKAILTDWETNLVEQSLTVNSEPQS